MVKGAIDQRGGEGIRVSTFLERKGRFIRKKKERISEEGLEFHSRRSCGKRKGGGVPSGEKKKEKGT